MQSEGGPSEVNPIYFNHLSIFTPIVDVSQGGVFMGSMEVI